MDIESMKMLDKYMGWTHDRISTTINNDQLVELIEKLKIDVAWYEDSNVWVADLQDWNGMGFEGKTLAEAVVNAAIEMVKK